VLIETPFIRHESKKSFFLEKYFPENTETNNPHSWEQSDFILLGQSKILRLVYAHSCYQGSNMQ